MSAGLPAALVADIGGTNARFALVNFDQGRPVLQRQLSLRCADFAGLEQAAEHYLLQVGAQPTRAAIAVASPVRAGTDEIRMTNRAWAFSRSALQQRLGLQSLSVHGAHSLMIAGGIVPRFIPFLRSSAFRERFFAKGRFARVLESVL